jgi:hypothetical protein
VKENVIKRVMASLKCGVCQQRYEPDNVTVLGYQEDLWFLRVFCLACHTQYLVAVVIKEGKAPEVITDLTEVELDKFNNAVGLTANEVLDMHNFLKDFDGDFSRLFGRE